MKGYRDSNLEFNEKSKIHRNENEECTHYSG